MCADVTMRCVASKRTTEYVGRRFQYAVVVRRVEGRRRDGRGEFQLEYASFMYRRSAGICCARDERVFRWGRTLRAAAAGLGALSLLCTVHARFYPNRRRSVRI